MRRSNLVILGIAALVTTTACSSLISPGQKARAQIRMNLGKLLPAETLPPSSYASVLSSTVLRITPDGHDTDVYPMAIVDSVVTFTAKEPKGEALIEGQVWSSNNTLIFDGSERATLEDGFAISLPIKQINSCLAISPPAISLATGGSATVSIADFGPPNTPDSLSWHLGSVEPPDTSWLFVTETSGGVFSPGSAHAWVVHRKASLTSVPTFRVEITSRVGHVFLTVHMLGS